MNQHWCMGIKTCMSFNILHWSALMYDPDGVPVSRQVFRCICLQMLLRVLAEWGVFRSYFWLIDLFHSCYRSGWKSHCGGPHTSQVMYTPSHLCSLSPSAHQWSSACSNSCPVAITLTQHCAMTTMDQNRQECYMTAVILHNGQSPSAACVELIRKWYAMAVHPTCCMLHTCST